MNAAQFVPAEELANAEVIDDSQQPAHQIVTSSSGGVEQHVVSQKMGVPEQHEQLVMHRGVAVPVSQLIGATATTTSAAARPRYVQPRTSRGGYRVAAQQFQNSYARGHPVYYHQQVQQANAGTSSYVDEYGNIVYEQTQLQPQQSMVNANSMIPEQETIMIEGLDEGEQVQFVDQAEGTLTEIGPDGTQYELIPLEQAPQELRDMVMAEAQVEMQPVQQQQQTQYHYQPHQQPQRVYRYPQPMQYRTAQRLPVMPQYRRSVRAPQPMNIRPPQPHASSRQGVLVSQPGRMQQHVTQPRQYRLPSRYLPRAAQPKIAQAVPAPKRLPSGALQPLRHVPPAPPPQPQPPKRVIRHTIILQDDEDDDDDDEQQQASTSEPQATDAEPDAKKSRLQSSESDETQSAVQQSVAPKKPIDYAQCEKLWRECVFRRLKRSQLIVCAQVCSSWSCWVDNVEQVWHTIDLNGKPAIESDQWRAIGRKKPVKLVLAWTGISSEDLARVIESDECLKELSLAGCHFSAAMALSALKSDLDSLDLSWAQGVTDGSFNELVLKCPRITRVQQLKLDGCDVSDTTVRSLANKFNNLRSLDVSNCAKISNLAVKFLCAKGHVARLTHLSMRGCDVTEDMFNAIRRYPSLKHLDLQMVKAFQTKVGKDSVERLIKDMEMEIFT